MNEAIRQEIKDKVFEIDGGIKYVTRTVKLVVPIDLTNIVNTELPENTILPEEVNDAEHYEREVEVCDDKIIVSLNYHYSCPVTKEERLLAAQKSGKERISNLKENLKLICDRFEISMEELMEQVTK